MKLLASLLAVANVVNGLADTDTITWGGDNSRTGYQTNHNMDPAIVGSAQFGQLYRTKFPGNYNDAAEQVFSQPLVYTPSGGDEQFVYVATTQNNVYKIEAKTGEIVASRNLHIPFLTAELDGCVDINPLIGVISTGVIDPETDTLYLTAKTYRDQKAGNGVQGRDEGRVYLHALDVNDLSEKPNFPVNLEGTVARNNNLRSFGGGIHLQRPALLHTRDFIYAGFASHCVQYNFTGWIMGWHKTTGEFVEAYAMEGEGVPADVKGGGIWMSGGGLASDDAGSIFYATGNGYASQLANVPVPGFNPPTALEEAAVHMTINDDGSLDVVDFFMPWEKQALDGADKDLGTSPLEILPSAFSCGEYRRIGVITGKSGKTYWLNLDDLGGYRMGDDGLDDIIQVYQNENSVYAGAGVYPLEGGYIYINVIQYPSHVFKFSCNNGKPAFTKVADTPVDNAYILGVSHGTVTSLKNQPGTGLLWIMDVQGYNLRIYDAVPKDGTLRLVNSFQVPGSGKFSRPVFGDGIMYQTTNQGYLYAFGSPINMPLNCTGTLDFGSVDKSEVSRVETLTCRALTDLTITGIELGEDKNFELLKVPKTPFTLSEGEPVAIEAKFKPSTVGFIAADVIFNSTANDDTFSGQSTSRLTGTGVSADPLLFVSPNTVTFQGVITGTDPNGVKENVQVTNRGDADLTITSIEYATKSEGPYSKWDGGSSLTVGKFTIKDIPKTVKANEGATLTITFDSSKSGDFGAFVKIISNGGTKSFTIAGSSGPAPLAQIDFQPVEKGNGSWVPYKSGQPFTFGNVTENTSRSLKLRVTNAAPTGGVRLYLTVSKPPFGGSGLIRAANQVDLAEGTSLAPGESAEAVLTCGSPKRQWNTDARNGTAVWTMNTNDETMSKQVIEFFCNSVAEQGGPLLADGEGQYRYVGCFKDNTPGRQLQDQVYGDDTNTNKMCLEKCAAKGWTFCGTQYQRECWGGDKIPKEKVAEANCNYACSGDVHQVCGGNGEGEGAGGAFMSVFADSLEFDGNLTRPDDGQGNGDGGNNGGGDEGNGGDEEAKPTVNPGVAGYTHIGCYTEATSTRALPHGLQTAKQAVKPCVEACKDAGYELAGLEYGGECWCGDDFGEGSVKAPLEECNMACNGNKTEYCGAGNRLNVYGLDDDSSPTPSEVPSGNSTMSTLTSVVSSTTSSATATRTTALAKPTHPAKIDAFTFQGCYAEPPNARALTDGFSATDDMTLDTCADFCDSYDYFGVEYGRECFCGNTLHKEAEQKDVGECSMKCAGNKGEWCGAGVRLSLYKKGSSEETTSVDGDEGNSTPTSTRRSSTSTASTTSAKTSSSSAPATPTVYPGNRNFTYHSCASEPSDQRLLPSQVLNDGDEMTIEKCLETCWMYKWVGVEYGRECWCGDSPKWVDGESEEGGVEVDEEGEKEELSKEEKEREKRCDMKCPGDKGVLCGGRSVLSLYRRKGDGDGESAS